MIACRMTTIGKQGVDGSIQFSFDSHLSLSSEASLVQM